MMAYNTEQMCSAFNLGVYFILPVAASSSE